MACIAIWFDISSTCGGVWSNGVEQNRETDEERDDYCVAKELQLSTWKFDREWEALGMELQYKDLRWIRTGISLIQEKSSLIFLLSGISNTSIFKVHDVLH